MDYMPIFDKITEAMGHNPMSSYSIMMHSTRRLADSLLYDSEDTRKFFIFCAMLGEMVLQCHMKGYRHLTDHVVRGASYLIEEKLGWSAGSDLKKYEIFAEDFQMSGT